MRCSKVSNPHSFGHALISEQRHAQSTSGPSSLGAADTDEFFSRAHSPGPDAPKQIEVPEVNLEAPLETTLAHFG